MRSLRNGRGIESLESRRHFDAYVFQGTLVVDGDWTNDTITVGVDPANSANVRTSINGVVKTFPANQFTTVVITAYDGNDSVQIVQPGGQVLNKFIEIYGNNGDDTIIGGDGPEYVDGQAGNDSIVGNGGNDTLHGGADNDTVIGGAGNDRICGENGNDQLRGGAGNDTILGNKGADILWGDKGSNYLDAGQFNDTIYSRNSEMDTVIGGAGIDQAQIDTGTDVTPFSDVETFLA